VEEVEDDDDDEEEATSATELEEQRGKNGQDREFLGYLTFTEE